MQSLARPGALTAGCVQVMFWGDRRYRTGGTFPQTPGLGDCQATPSSKPRPSGLLLLPPGPPKNGQVPVTAPIVPKDPGTQGISATEGGGATGLKRVHEIRTHGVRDLESKKGVGQTEKEERREAESLGERNRKREKEGVRDGEREEGQRSTERGVRGGGCQGELSGPPSSRLRGGRVAGNQAGRRQVVGADNGAEECGTWD